jgi:hypothetical protein
MTIRDAIEAQNGPALPRRTEGRIAKTKCLVSDQGAGQSGSIAQRLVTL